ncbi:hypothetical protein SASPL_149280 [Salvia splendens]|uniref:NADP-dependent oxidoreductase domain-containing protein n=1 Tax=Salvia splendens TaxID=180675 RepID=A0A8X8WC92_SALSN|nr:hypothetical protein SASPL_149280 [Salvia splendens]
MALSILYPAQISSSRSSIVPSPPLLKNLKLPRFWPWQKVKVGSLSVSPMGFGTWAWGNEFLWGYEESMDGELQQVFNLAVENGINLFDTADSYGTGRLNGQSEKLLGNFIQGLVELSFEFKMEDVCLGITKRRNDFAVLLIRYLIACTWQGNKQARDNIVIATKFAAYPWRLTPNQFVEARRSSLDRIQLDQIGIGQLHWSTALQERALWDGLVAMYDKGLVRAVGVSNYGPKQLLKIYDYLEARGVPLVSAQVQFSLLSMGEDQLEMKSTCDALGIRVIAYSPLGLGMLTGKYNTSNLPTGPRGFLFQQILPGLEPLLNRLHKQGEKPYPRYDQDMNLQVAINWCITKGTIPIPGVKTIKQTEENLGALGWKLSSDEMQQLESAALESPRKMVENIFQTR